MAGPHIGTGASATHSVVTTLDAAKITQIDEDGAEVPTIEASALSDTVWRTKLGGDLAEPGTVSMEILADTATRYTPGFSTKGTLTITDRQLTGETAAGKIEGAAWLMSATKSTPLEDVVTWSLEWQWETGPTFTAPVTS